MTDVAGVMYCGAGDTAHVLERDDAHPCLYHPDVARTLGADVVVEADLDVLFWVVRMRAALERMPAREAVVLRRHYLESWTLTEIGEAEGVSRTRIEGIMSVARGRLALLTVGVDSAREWSAAAVTAGSERVRAEKRPGKQVRPFPGWTPARTEQTTPGHGHNGESTNG